MKLAIIGTAGRGTDGKRLTLSVWNDMKRTVAAFVKEHGVRHVVSGAAAYADHLGVGLYLAGLIDHLDLMLPCPFDCATASFEDTGDYDSITNPGGVTAFYHRYFSKAVGISSLVQIEAAIAKGATVRVEHGFKARNTLVAEAADMVIAFTYGDGATVKDGGTADTCRKYLTRGGTRLYHVDLVTMIVHHPAFVS